MMMAPYKCNIFERGNKIFTSNSKNPINDEAIHVSSQRSDVLRNHTLSLCIKTFHLWIQCGQVMIIRQLSVRYDALI